MIVAIFLLLMEEEDAFWMMTAVIEEILPPSYYSPRYSNILTTSQIIEIIRKMFHTMLFQYTGSNKPLYLKSHWCSGRSNGFTGSSCNMSSRS